MCWSFSSVHNKQMMLTTIFHCALSQHLCKCNTGISIIITLHHFKYECNCKPSPFIANSLQEVFICDAHSGILCIPHILIAWWLSVFSTHSNRIFHVLCPPWYVFCFVQTHSGGSFILSTHLSAPLSFESES